MHTVTSFHQHYMCYRFHLQDNSENTNPDFDISIRTSLLVNNIIARIQSYFYSYSLAQDKVNVQYSSIIM